MMKSGKKPIGMTSDQAAALFLSDGATDNVHKAQLMSSGNTLEIDALQRAHLRRMMGFDFKMKITPARILLLSEDGPRVSARTRLDEGDLDSYNNIINPAVIERIVAACIKLKEKWDAANERTNAVR